VPNHSFVPLGSHARQHQQLNDIVRLNADDHGDVLCLVGRLSRSHSLAAQCSTNKTDPAEVSERVRRVYARASVAVCSPTQRVVCVRAGLLRSSYIFCTSREECSSRLPGAV
jgi:hypothetical protein